MQWTGDDVLAWLKKVGSRLNFVVLTHFVSWAFNLPVGIGLLVRCGIRLPIDWLLGWLIIIWHTAECLQVKYERMISGYYRSHAERYITSYMHQRMKDLLKVPTWRLEWVSNQRPSAPKAPNTTAWPARRYCLSDWLNGWSIDWLMTTEWMTDWMIYLLRLPSD